MYRERETKRLIAPASEERKQGMAGAGSPCAWAIQRYRNIVDQATVTGLAVTGPLLQFFLHWLNRAKMATIFSAKCYVFPDKFPRGAPVQGAPSLDGSSGRRRQAANREF